MKAKRWGIVGGILVLAGLVLAWVFFQPGPMAFAKGKRVTLAEYDGNPTGVPADFRRVRVAAIRRKQLRRIVLEDGHPESPRIVD
jgi:hypothetical protein